MAVITPKLLLWVYALLASLSALKAVNVIVPTEVGRFRGFVGETSRRFLGIRYARPPTGFLRWRSPEPPISWKYFTYDATRQSPGCPQIKCERLLPETACPDRTSEDCLFLNIWTPKDASTTKSYPVLVSFPGGAFEIGSASAEVLDGDLLASSTDIVVVVANYRLGLLGYLYTGDATNDANGNYGIQDQRMALQWVQDNIAQFGGDPNRVTIHGVSAGAQSVDIHLKSPKSQGLFHGAILQGAPLDVPYRTKPEALQQAQRFKDALECDEIICMRLKTVDDILEAQNKIEGSSVEGGIIGLFEPNRPFVDGEDIVSQPMEGGRLGQYNGVPTIIGTCKDEARLFVYAVVDTLPIETTVPFPYTLYVGFLFLLKQEQFIAISGRYPGPGGQFDQRDVFSELMTDYVFTCPNRYIARDMTKPNSDNTYRYIFDFAKQSEFVSITYGSFCEGYTCHGVDIIYSFGNLVESASEEEKQLSRSVMAYLGNFVHSGNPNIGPSTTRLEWPTYDPSEASTMYVGRTENTVQDYREDFCDFWDGIGYDN